MDLWNKNQLSSYVSKVFFEQLCPFVGRATDVFGDPGNQVEVLIDCFYRVQGDEGATTFCAVGKTDSAK